MSWSRRALFTPFLVAVALLAAAPARAQYFGRNPVQWERFKFELLKTEHFDIYYYAEGKDAAEQAGRMAERWYARLSSILDFQFKERQPLILYASHPQFQQTNTVGGPPGEGTGGVTEAFKRRIVLPVGASLAETDHVVGHELVHAFQYAMTGQGRVSSTNYPSALRMPLWLIEGMAEYLSLGPVDPHTAMWMRDAAQRDKLPTIRHLGSARYFPYRYGQALWAYLAGRFGDQIVGQVLRSIGPRATDAESVLKAVLGIDHETLSKDWHAAIKAAYQAETESKQGPEAYGQALITEKGQGGRLNVGPALSPDGGRVAFLSERDLFSVEVFVADAKSGRVEHRLSRSVTDPHLESLQFISSAGAFDRTGQRLALGAIAKGRPLLLIMDTQKGSPEKQVAFPELGEILTPSWSPDGKSVAFSAVVSGFTDLYLYDLTAGKLTRLTHDAYADLQPAWSPDGKSLAFVSDRFSTKLPTLELGNYRLALFDLASGQVRALPGFERAKHLNPQWSPTGESVYFLSDRSGATNIYRLELASGSLFQLTDLRTGASGITSLSPALSSAAASNRLAYSVYQADRYEIYTIDEAEKLAGTPVSTEEPTRAGLILGGQAKGSVVAALDNPTRGLADTSAFAQAPYKAKLGLDYVGQPTLAAGVDRFGSFVGGGISFSFSDMLGNHNLDTVIQADSVSGFTDIGAMLGYINRSRRLQWGLQLGQAPYVTGGYSAGTGTLDGQPVYIEQSQIERQIDRRLAGVAYYPFNPTLRVEGYAGLRHLSFDSRLETNVFDYVSGQLVAHQREDLPSLAPLTLGEGSLAVVRDTSAFGATSPVVGQRFRFEVSPVVGSVNYTGVLADFRQYLMPVRLVTLAGRVMHYGRYGSGGEDPRMNPLFLGYPSQVRGYDFGSFSASECGSTADGSCPVFDRLLGSRMLVANAEIRMPLLTPFRARKRNPYGPVPIEIGAFFDAGVAWDSKTSPSFAGGERDFVKSVGAVARVNVFGILIFEIDYAKPLDRPGKGAFFQFNFLAGF